METNLWGYNPTNFSNQFVQNALNPAPAPPVQTPYQSWSPVIQKAYNATTPVNTSVVPIQQPVQQTPTDTSQPRIGYDPSIMSPTPQSTPQSSSQQEIDAQRKADEAQNQMRSSIESGYNSYFGQLDNMLMQDLPSQRTAQEGIANTQYQQGVSDLNTQQVQALGDLGISSQQAEAANTKNLKGLAEDVRNSMRAGNVYLGTRGASDSSAANQYAYAIGKEANKNRSNLMANYTNVKNEIDNRIFKVKSTVQNEITRLKNDLQTKTFQIAQWFADAQNQIKQALAQGQLQKGTTLANVSQSVYNNAMQQLSTLQANSQNQKNALLQWATTRSTDLSQLQQNIAGAMQNIPQVAQAQGLNITPSFSGQNQQTYFPGFQQDNTKKDQFLFGGSGLSNGGATGGW